MSVCLADWFSRYLSYSATFWRPADDFTACRGVLFPSMPTAVHDDTGIVGDGVKDIAELLGIRINAHDACIEDFQHRCHVVRGVKNVEHGDTGTSQRRLHDEGDLGLNARLRHASRRPTNVSPL